MSATELADVLGVYCYARLCQAKREPRYLMCAQHWHQVPPPVQRHVVRAIGAFVKDPRHPGRKARLRMAIASARHAVERAEQATALV